MELTFILIFLVALAGFIKGFVGFGLSLVLITVLISSGIPTTKFLPILVPIFVILDIILYFENRKNVKLDFKENFTLHYTTLMSLFFGIMLGSYLLTVMDASIIKLIFAIIVLIVIFFLVEKVGDPEMTIPSERSNGFFGGITGVLTGLFTLNAVPPSIYLLYHKYPKEKYMGALVTFLIFSDLILVAVYLMNGFFTLEGFMISLKLLGIVLVGFFVGIVLRRVFPSKYFKSVVILVLAINSLKMIMDFFVG